MTKQKTRMVGVRFSDGFYIRLKLAANDAGLTVTELVRQICIEKIDSFKSAKMAAKKSGGGC